MQCLYPLPAYRKPDGNMTVASKGAYTDLSIMSGSVVPCGRCRACRANHAQSWATRAIHEAQEHSQNYFLTFTYDDENRHSPPNLHYSDIQNCYKKLRRDLGPLRT